jgi:hypothetical protein
MISWRGQDAIGVKDSLTAGTGQELCTRYKIESYSSVFSIRQFLDPFGSLESRSIAIDFSLVNSQQLAVISIRFLPSRIAIPQIPIGKRSKPGMASGQFHFGRRLILTRASPPQLTGPLYLKPVGALQR